jgi:prolyl-tRNA editing enzyme YbaK/EbsC (Cys-tRNA(Pro) deacylase)
MRQKYVCALFLQLCSVLTAPSSLNYESEFDTGIKQRSVSHQKIDLGTFIPFHRVSLTCIARVSRPCTFANAWTKCGDELRFRTRKSEKLNEQKSQFRRTGQSFARVRPIGPNRMNSLAHPERAVLEDSIDDVDREKDLIIQIQERASAFGVSLQLTPAANTTLKQGPSADFTENRMDLQSEQTEMCEVLKSLVFDCSGEPVLVVLRSSHLRYKNLHHGADALFLCCSISDRVDTCRLSDALMNYHISDSRVLPGGRLRCKLASAADAEEWTGFKIGNIPPLNHRRPLLTLVDKSVFR